MYFPIGWPQTLSCDDDVQSIFANSDQSLFLLISKDSLSIWFCRPPIKIVSYQRTNESLNKYGHNISACWRSDSSLIVIQTSNDYLLFYQVIINDQDVMPIIEPKSNIASNSSVSEDNRVPCLFLQLRNSLKIEEGITCIMSAEEEMVISTKTGLLCGIEWDGHPDDNFRFNISVPPNHYLKKESGNTYHIIDFKYSTIIGGFSLVFSNGLGAFLPLNENTSTFTQLQLISHVDNALCTAINHKYAFIVFGLISSDAVACDFDEVDRRFVISYRLSLPSNVYSDAAEKILGPLISLQWTPDSSVLATIWENGDFALWSVFGSLLTYSLSWHSNESISNNGQYFPFKVSSLAFGKEGFHLWMVIENHQNNDSVDAKQHLFKHHVCKLSLVKSVLAANPCSSVNLESILLSSEDRIFVGGNKNSSLTSSSASSSLIAQNNINNRFENENEKKAQTESLKNEKLSNAILSEQESNAVDSFQWITVSIPQNYLETNWPIRLFAIDSHTSQNIAVAGLNGFAMYSLVQRRWKMFGNENHEKDVTVTGGFLWYYDYLIAGCYNLSDESFEIRAYSHRNKLDNSNAKIVSIEYEVQLLSLYQNRLLALCSNGNIYLFDLHLFKRNHHYSSSSIVDHHHLHDYDLNISAPIRVLINNLEIFPDCVTSCLLTDLHVDMLTTMETYHHHHRSSSSIIQNSFASHTHSILINICGRVLLLEMDIDTSKLPLSSDEDDDDCDTLKLSNNDSSSKSNNNSNNNNNIINGNNNDHSNQIKFKKVVKLASNVENLWVLPHDHVQLNAFSSSSSSSASTTSQRNSYQMRPHLETSLYLSCGGHGMAIWLSLEHSIRPQFNHHQQQNTSIGSNTNEHTFISKRIMLPLSEIGSTIYPLAIRFRDAIVLGAESDFTQPNKNSSQLFAMIPYFVVKRTSQVYLHYILRELLRRNLGYRSWEIANTCSTLPHFVHSLELLLHGVLEEEASSSQPIPDALLPRVVDFIRAFPVFLQTVIHCARKSELAIWPHLFSIVGSPKDLFQQCLQEGQLDTASSYIIVLQNLEKPEVASKCASRLLQAARVAGCWITVKELKRFLRATNQAAENEESPTNEQGKSSRRNSVGDKQQQPVNMDDSVNIITTPTTSTSHSPDIIQSSSNMPIINGSIMESSNVIKNRTARLAPGVAIKSIDNNNHNSQQNLDKSKCSIVEENIIMNETHHHHQHKDPEESSLNHRAYPGTILRMTSQDNDGNNDLNHTIKFLTINEDSSVSSFVSSSSSSSSTFSSTSSPTTRVNHYNNNNNTDNDQRLRNNFHRQQPNNFKTIKHGESNNVSSSNSSNGTNIIEKLPPLRAISISDNNDREQCTIS